MQVWCWVSYVLLGMDVFEECYLLIVCWCVVCSSCLCGDWADIWFVTVYVLVLCFMVYVMVEFV